MYKSIGYACQTTRWCCDTLTQTPRCVRACVESSFLSLLCREIRKQTRPKPASRSPQTNRSIQNLQELRADPPLLGNGVGTYSVHFRETFLYISYCGQSSLQVRRVDVIRHVCLHRDVNTPSQREQNSRSEPVLRLGLFRRRRCAGAYSTFPLSRVV